MHMCKMLRRNQAQKALLSSLSPTLSNEVVDHCYRSWIAKVWYLNLQGISNDFIQRVANALGAELFAPMELIETHDTLYIITCGLAMRNGQLIRKGDVWNEDFLLPFASSEEALQRARCVTAAFSYIEVLALSHEAAEKKQKVDDFMNTEFSVKPLGKAPSYKVTLYHPPRVGARLALEVSMIHFV